MPGIEARTTRADRTRESILTAAERLLAEQGVAAVSSRRVSEAARQGNNAAVGYHFGSKADLLRAIVRKHTTAIELIRSDLLTAAADSTELRDWVACLVRPYTEHLAALGNPTWYARFAVQAMADPTYREIMTDEAFSAPSFQQTVEGLNRCLPTLPLPVRLERQEMASHLLLQVCAERERSLARGVPPTRRSWADAATGLIDVLVALWSAPITECSVE
ncbi:TetR/AcrR family transcriptional regulator [Nocardia sp. CA2R105]|uniref:TetR/AcrR family transcriptional regulator n=1 Tax=Nocardia coffeae TaxID=2873381 RepID=UPI001CA6EEE6|nr:TetR/AcrR family transcriptional regulator [Nocardia coffeae]MBY8860880.1 TetR/AcrR family transcriptional regulator [Nocardia coffeae]